jgi:Tol biopolymer transport system component/DNA-binding winged helix-turn-helix (wHTH) protein
MEVARKAPVRFGEFEFDPAALKLFRAGRPVKIEPQPSRVLAVLLENPGQIVSRDELRARIWGQATFVEFDESLNYCIRQIRVALREQAAKPRLLETLPKQGYRFIGAVEVQTPPKDPEAEPSESAPIAVSGYRWRRATAAVAVVALLGAAIAWFVVGNRRDATITALNLSILPPAATSFVYGRNGEGGFAISPDGAALAFIGRTEGKAQLWVRRLDQADSRLVPGSEGAYRPFWSPDSRWIAFFTPLKLKKVEVANGTTVDLCDVPPNTSGGTWSTRGVILWGTAMGTHPIQKISDLGGVPVAVPATAGIEPHFLPDGQRFVYRAGYWSSDLWLASLDPGEKPQRIGTAGSEPTYSAGHLLWVSDGTLMAQRFDAARGRFIGAVMRVNAPLAVRVHLGLLLSDFSANPNGMLVYPPRTNALAELRWRDRTGKLLNVVGEPGEYYTPRLSPDGRRVAFTRRGGNNSDVWISNPTTNTLTRLTFDPAIDDYPVWSPDGTAVTFANNGSGVANLYRKAAAGTGTVERLTSSPNRQQALDWSGDGRFLLFTEITSTSEIMVRSATGGQPLRYLNHGLGATKAQFIPGAPRWIAYDFDDSGQREIYVQVFEPGKTAPPARWQISTAGGTMPRWRGDGKEIFYLSLDGKMMATRVSGEKSSFESSTPEVLFHATPPLLRSPSFEYDVTSDGQRFLMIEPAEKPEYLPLTLVSRWMTR